MTVTYLQLQNEVAATSLYSCSLFNHYQ